MWWAQQKILTPARKMVFAARFWPGEVLEPNIRYTQSLYHPITYPETIFDNLSFFDPPASKIENRDFKNFKKYHASRNRNQTNVLTQNIGLNLLETQSRGSEVSKTSKILIIRCLGTEIHRFSCERFQTMLVRFRWFCKLCGNNTNSTFSSVVTILL